ncbi:enoyl Coenzyme A hydratase [Cavenderia fasciculata]|uniref:Enoyl Coenzyme A hydratase n=1 Tax=Cavenderia fasciculata TaxID=261658 RepID=F4PPS9_CACFS|nr:enoyl Coenzyme A hydratase [Cavenderia fasciculata]EGG22392.1 enoyl Coenzyme A hydratase [Cavenderia fasciculata]|eukprot:XP_004360243.1 enoyl Coenzyme A hydratase [Cavenderia fasciculata]
MDSLFHTNNSPSFYSVVKTIDKYEHLKLEKNVDTGVAELILTSSNGLNLMSDQFFDELISIFETIQLDEKIRVVIIYSDGKIFSGGLDLAAASSQLSDTEGTVQEQSSKLFRLIRRWQCAFDRIEKCLKPVIAAVHGHCLGGAIDLITACDIRLCSSDATFSILETKLAIVADLGTLQRIQRICGVGNAREMAYTSRRIDSATASRYQLVNNVYSDKTTLLQEAHKLAKQIAANSPLVVQSTKMILNHSLDHKIDEGLLRVALHNTAFLRSNDLMEAVSSFMEKRTPIFKSNFSSNSLRGRSSSMIQGQTSPTGSRFIRLMNRYKELEMEWWSTLSEEDEQLLQDEGLDIKNMLFFSEVLFTVARFKPMMMFSYLPESMLQSYHERVIIASGLLQTLPDIVFKKCKSIETDNTVFENTAVLYFKQSIKQYQQQILNQNNNQTNNNNQNNQSNNNEEIIITATSPRSLSSSPSLNIKQMLGQLSQSTISLFQNIDQHGENTDLLAKEVELAELFDYPTNLPEHIRGSEDQFYDVGYSCCIYQSKEKELKQQQQQQNPQEMDDDERIVMSYFIPRHQLHIIQDRIKQHHHTYATLFKVIFGLDLKLRIAQAWDD